MTRRRFAMPCSFSVRKTARRYGFQGLLGLRSLSLCFPGLAANDPSNQVAFVDAKQNRRSHSLDKR